MAYNTGETAILTRIRLHASYDADNTSQAKWDLLNKGTSAYYAILRPGDGDAPLEWITYTVYTVTWETVIEVWQRYTEPNTTAVALWGHVQEIIAQTAPQNKLGLTSVQNAGPVAVRAPVEMRNPKKNRGSPLWLKQEVSLEWIEQSNPITYV